MNKLISVRFIIPYLMTFLFSTLLYGQRITEIRVSSSEISKYSNAEFMGHLLPISMTRSIVDFGNVKIGLIDNNSGEAIKYLDELELQRSIEKRIPSHWSNKFSFYKPQQFGEIQSCASFPFRYCKPTQISDSEIVIEVSLYLKNNSTSKSHLTKGILYLSPQLEIIDFVFMDKIEDENFLTTSEDGWFWLDENNIYIKKFLISKEYFHSRSKAFAYFEKINNSFVWVNDLEISDLPKRKNLALGRNFAIRQVQGNYYVNNDSIIIKTKNLIDIDQTFKPASQPNESLCNFLSVGENHFIGLIKQLDGALTRIVKLDQDFNIVKEVSQYKDKQYSINSIEFYEGKLYVFIFDETKKKYLLEKIEI